MYKNLNPTAMGLSGRQSELVELALSHGFASLTLDIEELYGKVEKKGIQHAARFLTSADVKAGPFKLPVNWQEDDEKFQADLTRLEGIAPIAAQLGARSCWTTVMAASDELPYHENFEFHRGRFSAIADILAPHDLWLGLAFLAPAEHREGKQHQFISSPDSLVTLMKTVGVKNVGIVVDLWHWRVGGGALEHLREVSPEQITNVRLADVPADMSLESLTDRDRTLPSSESEFLIEAVRILIDMGYEGPLTPMPSPSRMPRQTRDARAISAAAAVEILCKAARNEEIPTELAVPEEREEIEVEVEEVESKETEVAEEPVEAT